MEFKQYSNKIVSIEEHLLFRDHYKKRIKNPTAQRGGVLHSGFFNVENSLNKILHKTQPSQAIGYSQQINKRIIFSNKHIVQN